MLCALIMAGGRGTRFWPLSTEEKPKQFLSLLGNETMLQMTYNRINKLVPRERIFISTGVKYRDLVLDQLDDISHENIIVEPESRNTSACICLSSMFIKKQVGDCDIVVSPSDHLIKDDNEFIITVNEAVSFLKENKNGIITFGIRPSRPEIGYGYIRSDLNSMSRVKRVDCFVEKPNYNTAIEYVRNGNYYWNSGIFVWNVDVILSLIKEFLIDTYNALSPILDISSDRYLEFVNKNYSLTDSISIDYGVMEKYNNIFVVEARFGWDDVGSWSSVDRYGEKDNNGNVLNSGGILMKSNNNIVLTKKKILLNNVDDLIVVETDDCILVSSKEHAQDIKLARNYM